MEKKNIRPAQANKGLVASKKGQDSVAKTGQRHGNRREGSSTGKPRDNFNSNVNNRPTPPRPKTQNLPKARGGNGFQRNNLSCTEYDRTVNDFTTLDTDHNAAADDAAELYSVFVPGSKKQNLNHLLNFQYAPRERYNAPQSFGRSSRMTLTHRAAYDKRQFLQANCQFIVRPTAISTNATNIAYADTLVDWEPIEQIYLTTFEDLQCPICLFPPVACKITKCGHIYCWPCILHYLALSDKPWRRCPICHEAVSASDLKSAIGKPVTFSKTSDVVTFELKKRERDSLVVTNASTEDTVSAIPSSLDLGIFSKIFLAEVETINEIIDREKRELQTELANQGTDCPESVFIEQALVQLDERRAQILENIPRPAQPSEIEGAMADTSFYFYQCSDGQHMYLDPINNKMLEATFGHVKNAPPFITGKILQKQSKSMNEGVRKRYKYLAHLPLTCELDFVELEFIDPVIPDEIIQSFQSNLKQRESKRIYKEHAENVRSKKIEKENNKQCGFRCEPEPIPINIDSIEQFPGYVEVETAAAKSLKNSGPSFAKVMNSSGQSFWPTLPSSTGLQQFVPNAATKTMPPHSSSPSSSISYDEIDDALEGLKVAERLSIGGFIAEAIEKGAVKAAKTKGKKGKKGVPLLSTGMPTFK